MPTKLIGLPSFVFNANEQMLAYGHNQLTKEDHGSVLQKQEIQLNCLFFLRKPWESFLKSVILLQPAATY